MAQPITDQHVSATRAHSCSSSHLQANAGPPAAVFCSATSRRIPSAYPAGHSRGGTPHALNSRSAGAPHSRRPPVEHVRVDLRGAHVAVPEELLDGSDIVPVLAQMGREGVTQCVRRGPLRDPGTADRTFHYALEHGLVQVVPPPLVGVSVHI